MKITAVLICAEVLSLSLRSVKLNIAVITHMLFVL